MNPERLRQVEELYHAARERSPGKRDELLAQADAELRREVESLLAQDGEGVLDRPAIAVAADLLEDSSAEQLSAGAQLGPYRIESSIGAGGMGQVYKARDTRLRRAVAIKVSSKQFNPRFEREARAISALNHPHICTLYDVGPDYLVMELVDGPTLAERLKQDALPVESVLRYGAQIADALADPKTLLSEDAETIATMQDILAHSATAEDNADFWWAQAVGRFAPLDPRWTATIATQAISVTISAKRIRHQRSLPA